MEQQERINGYYDLANRACNDKEFSETRSWCMKILSINPNHLDARLMKAYVEKFKCSNGRYDYYAMSDKRGIINEYVIALWLQEGGYETNSKMFDEHLCEGIDFFDLEQCERLEKVLVSAGVEDPLGHIAKLQEKIEKRKQDIEIEAQEERKRKRQEAERARIKEEQAKILTPASKACVWILVIYYIGFSLIQSLLPDLRLGVFVCFAIVLFFIGMFYFDSVKKQLGTSLFSTICIINPGACLLQAIGSIIWAFGSYEHLGFIIVMCIGAGIQALTMSVSRKWYEKRYKANLATQITFCQVAFGVVGAGLVIAYFLLGPPSDDKKKK